MSYQPKNCYNQRSMSHETPQIIHTKSHFRAFKFAAFQVRLRMSKGIKVTKSKKNQVLM